MTAYNRLYVALVTPFDDGGRHVNLGELRRLATMFCNYESPSVPLGVIVNPEAGELFALSSAEATESVEAVVDVVRRRIPVFAGVTGVTTAAAQTMASAAVRAGADGIFAMPPLGGLDITFGLDSVRYPQVWIEWLQGMIADVPEAPVIVHPLTGKAHPVFGDALPLEAMTAIIAAVPQIVGWKMTYPYGAVRVLAAALREASRNVAVLPANGSYFHEYLLNGFVDGAVTGCLNYSLEPMVAHIDAWRKDDLATARSLWDGGLRQLQSYVHGDVSRLHVRFKTATWLRGHITSPVMRAPMPSPMPEEVLRLAELLTNVGLSTIDGARIREAGYPGAVAIEARAVGL